MLCCLVTWAIFCKGIYKAENLDILWNNKVARYACDVDIEMHSTVCGRWQCIRHQQSQGTGILWQSELKIINSPGSLLTPPGADTSQGIFSLQLDQRWLRLCPRPRCFVQFVKMTRQIAALRRSPTTFTRMENQKNRLWRKQSLEMSMAFQLCLIPALTLLAQRSPERMIVRQAFRCERKENKISSFKTIVKEPKQTWTFLWVYSERFNIKMCHRK